MVWEKEENYAENKKIRSIFRLNGGFSHSISSHFSFSLRLLITALDRKKIYSIKSIVLWSSLMNSIITNRFFFSSSLSSYKAFEIFFLLFLLPLSLFLFLLPSFFLKTLRFATSMHYFWSMKRKKKKKRKKFRCELRKTFLDGEFPWESNRLRWYFFFIICIRVQRWQLYKST